MAEVISLTHNLAIWALLGALILPAGRWSQGLYWMSGAAAVFAVSNSPDAASLSNAVLWPAAGALLLAFKLLFSTQTLDLSGYWAFVITGAIQAGIILSLFGAQPAGLLPATYVLVVLGITLPLIALSRLFHCDASISAFTTGGTFIFVAMGTSEPVCLVLEWPLCIAPTFGGIVAPEVLAVMIGAAAQLIAELAESLQSNNGAIGTVNGQRGIGKAD